MSAKKRIETLMETEEGVSVISAETYFKGNLNAKGSIRVDGNIEGKITQSHAVVIGRSGKVKGDIVADNVVIAGQIDGSLCVTDLTELQAGCIVNGDIRSTRLLIEEGAVFNGRIAMGPEAAAVKEDGKKHDPEKF